MGAGTGIRWRRPTRASGQLLLGIVVGVIVTGVWPERHSLPLRILAGWNAGAIALLAFVWGVMLTNDAERTKCRAAAFDPGRTVVWLLVLLACGIGLFAGAVVMRRAASIDPDHRPLLVVLCLVSVVVAWTLTHTAFTMRYAHLYYRDDEEGEGGIGFPGDRPPADFDFAYLSYTIGMCFQVADVTISSQQIRRTVLGHALLSFAYNTVIVALTLNLLLVVLA